MTFSIFLPDPQERNSPPPPVLYYLGGLTATDDLPRTKANYSQEAARVGLAVVFPDTSPRGANIDTEVGSDNFLTEFLNMKIDFKPFLLERSLHKVKKKK